MARPIKKGLDYFCFDVDFFEDEKITAISGEFGIKGEIVAIKLLCAIYRNGYFTMWNELLKYKLLRSLPGISAELLESIVSRLVLWGFFDKSLFDSTGILTSKGIQLRYFEASKRRIKTDEEFPYLLIEIQEKVVSVDIMQQKLSNNGVNVYRNPSNEELMHTETTQIKVNKSKLNKKKENTPKGVSKKEELSLPPSSIDYVALANIFNTKFIGKLPAISKMTEARKRTVRARVCEHGKDAVMKVFDKVLASKFLLGANEKNWVADFDWIFTASNFVKILEGVYDTTHKGMDVGVILSDNSTSKYEQDDERWKR